MSVLAVRHQRAIDTLDGFLRSCRGAERLTGDEAIAAGLAGADAWRFPAPGLNGIASLLLAADRRYPATPPLIVIPDGDEWEHRIPHVSSHGEVCVMPPHATVDQWRIEDVADHIIDEAVDTIRAGLSGENRKDFIAEIQTYWAKKADGLPVWSLLRPEPPSRRVWCVSCKGFILVGETREDCMRWLANSGRPRPHRRSMGFGFLLWTENELYPDQYFARNRDLFEFLAQGHEDDLRAITRLAGRSTKQIPSVINLGTPHGRANLAVSVNDLSAIPGERIRGFRDGRLPCNLFVRRYGRQACTKRTVQRVDPDWVHTRGGGKDIENIRTRSVVIIGCGSLGSEVSQMLANSGIPKMRLIDPDVLTWDNVGRHRLGGDYVGEKKAHSLKACLNRQFPHLEIHSEAATWEDVFENNPEKIADSDLVISLTGEWKSESALNSLAISRTRPPVIFGWTEPHGLAGHALLVARRGGCLGCGRDELGHVSHRVVAWKEEPIERLPACGGFFQPYGAVETGPINSMIASLVIETLLRNPIRSELRTWIGDTSRIAQLGGTIEESWRPRLGEEQTLGRLLRTDWPGNPECLQCRGR